jgi:hypothetical protein
MLRHIIAFVWCLIVSACDGGVSPTTADGENGGSIHECNIDPDTAKTEAEREWLVRTPVCAVRDNSIILYRENCLGRHALNGLPCKVCQGFTACFTPILDWYCVDLDKGCQDPACPVDRSIAY